MALQTSVLVSIVAVALSNKSQGAFEHSATKRTVVKCQGEHTPGTDALLIMRGNNQQQGGTGTMMSVVASILNPSNGTKDLVQGRTYLFLLGYPFTGTTAAHFLLGTSNAVSTLGTDTFGPGKEGWMIAGYQQEVNKNKIPVSRKNDANGHLIPWDRLLNVYRSHWNMSKPILLENSPPEIHHAPRLYQEVKKIDPKADVRFILLVRSPCNERHIHHDLVHLHRLRRFRELSQKFGRRYAFLLRYEDLCFHPNEIVSALNTWLPGLGSIDMNLVPANAGFQQRPPSELPAHHDAQQNIPAFCLSKVLPQLPYRKEIIFNDSSDAINSLIHFFHYSVNGVPQT